MSTMTLDLTTSLRAPLQTTKPQTATLPSTLDFDFDSLRNAMSTFTARFDDYIKRSRAQLLQDRTEHRHALFKLSEQTHQTESQIQRLEREMQNHDGVVKSQESEIETMKREVEDAASVRDQKKEAVEGLRNKERDARRLLTDAKARSKQKKEWLDGQRAQDVKELAFWEDVLGVRMEGTGREDVVRFVFVFEGPAQRASRVREASFELNMGRGYVVEGCEPPLGEWWGDVQRLGRAMEDSEELSGLLKGMRNLFIKKLCL
ncbi:MAG: hypothetical protein Q9162_002672 [Coniocarpon cinnabarinum]